MCKIHIMKTMSGISGFALCVVCIRQDRWWTFSGNLLQAQCGLGQLHGNIAVTNTNKSCLGPKRSLQDHIYQIMAYNMIINIYEQYTYIWIKTFLSLIIFYLLFEFMYVIVNTTNLLKNIILCHFAPFGNCTVLLIAGSGWHNNNQRNERPAGRIAAFSTVDTCIVNLIFYSWRLMHSIYKRLCILNQLMCCNSWDHTLRNNIWWNAFHRKPNSIYSNIMLKIHLCLLNKLEWSRKKLFMSSIFQEWSRNARVRQPNF